jgi:hypothetical protein
MRHSNLHIVIAEPLILPCGVERFPILAERLTGRLVPVTAGRIGLAFIASMRSYSAEIRVLTASSWGSRSTRDWETAAWRSPEAHAVLFVTSTAVSAAPEDPLTPVSWVGPGGPPSSTGGSGCPPEVRRPVSPRRSAMLRGRGNRRVSTEPRWRSSPAKPGSPRNVRRVPSSVR